MNKYTTALLGFRSSIFYTLIIVIYFFNTFLSLSASIGIWDRWHLFTNISESMKPHINWADLVIVSAQDETTYEVGDIVSFYAEIDGREEVITHRIHEIGGNVYITKGDNNTYPDEEFLKPRLIIGKVVNTVPYVGYAVMALKSAIGKLTLILLPMLFIIFMESLSLYAHRSLKNEPVVQ